MGSNTANGASGVETPGCELMQPVKRSELTVFSKKNPDPSLSRLPFTVLFSTVKEPKDRSIEPCHVTSLDSETEPPSKFQTTAPATPPESVTDWLLPA